MGAAPRAVPGMGSRLVCLRWWALRALKFTRLCRRCCDSRAPHLFAARMPSLRNALALTAVLVIASWGGCGEAAAQLTTQKMSREVSVKKAHYSAGKAIDALRRSVRELEARQVGGLELYDTAANAELRKVIGSAQDATETEEQSELLDEHLDLIKEAASKAAAGTRLVLDDDVSGAKVALQEAMAALGRAAAKATERAATDKEARRQEKQQLDEVAAALEEEPRKKKAKKAPKDPNKPKGARSAWIFYTKVTFPEIQKAHADWGFGEVNKELSKRWKAMDDEAKKPFTEQAAADKTRYETEMAKYTPPADAQRPKKQKTGGRDTLAPKNATNAWQYFIRATRPDVVAENKDLSSGEVMKELKERWKGLDDAERQPFLDEAAKDKERFHEEMAAYKGPCDADDAPWIPAVANSSNPLQSKIKTVTRGSVWKSTSELGYPENYYGDLRDPPRHRTAATTGTTSRRRRWTPEYI